MKKAMDSLKNSADEKFFAFVQYMVENGATWKYSTELPEAYLMIDEKMAVILYFRNGEPYADFESTNAVDRMYFAWERENTK